MEPTFCANPECIRHTQHCGGKFRMVGGKWYCYPGCAENLAVMNPGKALWDFTTTHFDGHPRKVKSLGHLRQLERQFGVSNWAANNMEKNW